jgi:hypothetical protein
MLPVRKDNRRLIAKIPRQPRAESPISGRGAVMAPAWLTVVAWLYLSICFCSAAVIAYDIFINNRRQPMGVMNAVFPITALYFGPLAVAFYWRWRRAAPNAAPMAVTPAPASEPSKSSVGAHMSSAGTDMGMPMPLDDDRSHRGGVDRIGPVLAAGSKRSRPWWAMMATEVSHCGSGCVLGDVIAEFVIFGLAITIAGAVLPAEYIGDFVVALVFGIVFQYFAIAPMRGLGLRDGLEAAAKADFISLTAFEVGLFSWMAIMAFVLFPAPHHLLPNSAAFWFLMQIGMIVGFVTSWPANVWLINRGIKVPM